MHQMSKKRIIITDVSPLTAAADSSIVRTDECLLKNTLPYIKT